jgi:exodeoxyribonuclease-5
MKIEQVAAGIAELLARPDPPRVIKVQGAAGTAKTTGIGVPFANRPGAIALAPTNRAASRLREKGVKRASTAHAFLFGAPEVVTMADGERRLEWQRKPAPPSAKLIVLDEAYQAPPFIGRALLATGIPIITLGDPFQLPPIEGEPFFAKWPSPLFKLTEVHRQAADSLILEMATEIRLHGELPTGKPYDPDETPQRLANADIVICALRDTARRINARVRKHRLDGFNPYRHRLPIVGDMLIATGNDRESGIFNGTIWQVSLVQPRSSIALDLSLIDPDTGEYREALVPKGCFDPECGEVPKLLPSGVVAMDFGYCLTAHRAQGSEWRNAVILDESRSYGFERMRPKGMKLKEFTKRWMYTSVTRASNHVEVIEFS